MQDNLKKILWDLFFIYFAGVGWNAIFLREGTEVIAIIGSIFFYIKGIDVLWRLLKYIGGKLRGQSAQV